MNKIIIKTQKELDELPKAFVEFEALAKAEEILKGSRE